MNNPVGATSLTFIQTDFDKEKIYGKRNLGIC
jgi:hypothetical protein